MSDTATADTGQEPRRQATLCAATGRMAGEISRKVLLLKDKLEAYSRQLGRLVYRTACPQAVEPPGCAPQAKGARKSAAARLQEKRQQLLSELGAEVARLHREEVPDAMSQPVVQEIIAKISEADARLAARGKKRGS